MPGPWCTDPECEDCQNNRLREPVCDCGDWQHQHPNGTGRCSICRGSRAPWDNCTEFRFSHWESHDEWWLQYQTGATNASSQES